MGTTPAHTVHTAQPSQPADIDALIQEYVPVVNYVAQRLACRAAGLDGLPVAAEHKVALSRPVCWTAKLHTGVVADCGFLLVGTRDLRERIVSGACNRLPICVSAVQTRTSHTTWGERRAARSGELACGVDDRASHLLQHLGGWAKTPNICLYGVPEHSGDVRAVTVTDSKGVYDMHLKRSLLYTANACLKKVHHSKGWDAKLLALCPGCAGQGSKQAHSVPLAGWTLARPLRTGAPRMVVQCTSATSSFVPPFTFVLL